MKPSLTGPLKATAATLFIVSGFMFSSMAPKEDTVLIAANSAMDPALYFADY